MSIKPSGVLDELAVISDCVGSVEVLVQEAHEIAHGSRRIGDVKVRGGFTPDQTGERASCLCGGTRTGEEEPVGDRDPRTGAIVHVCSPARYRQAAKDVVAARVVLVRAVAGFSSITRGSDHHGDEAPFESADRKKILPEDFNPASMRALELKAKRLAAEQAESFRRRLLTAGVPRQRAEALADRVRTAIA